MDKGFLNKKITLYFLAALCAIFWGFAFLGTRVGLEKMGVLQLLALRWTISAIVFLLLWAFKIIKINLKGKNIKILILLGALQPCLYSIFETTGIKHTTISESSIIIAVIPLMVIFVGSVFFRKKASKRSIIAVLMAFIGVITTVIFSPSFSLGGKWFGYLSLFGAVTCGAFYFHVSVKASEDFNTMEKTMGISVMGAIVFNILSFASGDGLEGYKAFVSDSRTFISVLFLGVCCSCICYILVNYLIEKLPAQVASNFTANGTTVIGILSGIAITGDPWGWYTIIGVGLTMGGIYLSAKEEDS